MDTGIGHRRRGNWDRDWEDVFSDILYGSLGSMKGSTWMPVKTRRIASLSKTAMLIVGKTFFR